MISKKYKETSIDLPSRAARHQSFSSIKRKKQGFGCHALLFAILWVMVLTFSNNALAEDADGVQGVVVDFEIMNDGNQKKLDTNEVDCTNKEGKIKIHPDMNVKGCNWVEKDPEKRCETKKARDHCPAICDDRCRSEAPSSGPTLSSKPSISQAPSNEPSISHKPSTSQVPTNEPSISHEPTTSQVPTNEPSISPSQKPSISEAPTNQPTCANLPSSKSEGGTTEIWRMPDDSIWKGTEYVGKTCGDLQKDFGTDSETWCKFLSNGIVSDHTPMTSCCFCGGGNNSEETCVNLSFSDLKDGGIECAHIEELPNTEKFCRDHEDDTFSRVGITIREACCVCGGGEIVMKNIDDAEKLNQRRLIDNSALFQTVSSSSVLDTTEEENVKTVNHNHDISWFDKNKAGGGFSAGVPNLEYLGIGYNAFEGWPRGSEFSKLDPGFRYRILKLNQIQSNLTSDTEFTVPVGTELKYTSTCVYDDKSIEISTKSDLKLSLEKEVNFEESQFKSSRRREKKSGSGLLEDPAVAAALTVGTLFAPGIGLGILLADQLLFSRTVETETREERVFEKNTQYSQTVESSLKTNTRTFEARAVCSEFEASFSPFAKKEYDYIFQTAIQDLPVPFNAENPSHVEKYSKFIEAYGTHIVTHVVLGGKRIVNTQMSSSDFSSLVAEDVDVAETLSYEVASSMATSNVMNLAAVKAASSAATGLIGQTGGKAAAVANAVDVVVQSFPDEPMSTETEEVSRNFTRDFSKNRRQAEAASKISTKQLFSSEITIGGSPDIDWRSWSKTVRDKPMPISYSLTPMIDIMSYEQAIAFNQALKSIYNQYIGPRSKSDTFPLNMHMGVFRGEGQPISNIPYDQSVTLKSRITTKKYSSYPRDKSFDFSDPIDLLNYGLAWRGKPNIPLPMFANVIQGDVASNSEEEKVGYFLKKQSLYRETNDNGKNIGIIDYQNFFPFATCTDTISQCLLAFSNFDYTNQSRYKTPSRSFSFIQVDSRLNEDSAVAGVVSSDGVILGKDDSFAVRRVHDDYFGSRFRFEINNSNFSPCFLKMRADVDELVKKYEYLESLISFCAEKSPENKCCLDFGLGCVATVEDAKTESAKYITRTREKIDLAYETCKDNLNGGMRYHAKSDVPIVILFPRVEDDNYPDNIRDISYFIIPQTSHSTSSFKFEAKSSFKRSGTGFAPTGLNFLALSPLGRKENAKFGYIHGLPNAEDHHHRLYGLKSVSIEFKTGETELQGAFVNAYKDSELRSKKCKQSRRKSESDARENLENGLNRCTNVQFLLSCSAENYESYSEKLRIIDKVYRQCLENDDQQFNDITTGNEGVYSFPSVYYGYSGRFGATGNTIRKGKNLYGGVRVTFDKPFETIPSVVVTPVFSDDSKCPVLEEIEKGGDNNQLKGIHGILQCMVETITREDCFIKCVCIKETFIQVRHEVSFVEGVNSFDYSTSLAEKCTDNSSNDEKVQRICQYLTDEIDITPVPFNILAAGPSGILEQNTSLNIVQNGITGCFSRDDTPKVLMDGKEENCKELDNLPVKTTRFDLGSVYDIEKVVIHFFDSLASCRYVLSILNNNGDPVFRGEQQNCLDKENRFDSVIRGMYIDIEFDSEEQPESMELEVMGSESDSFPYNIALGKSVSFVKNEQEIDPSILIDGVTMQPGVDLTLDTLEIDLGREYSILEIKIHADSLSLFQVIVKDRWSEDRLDAQDNNEVSLGGKVGSIIKLENLNSTGLVEIEVIGRSIEKRKNKEGDKCYDSPNGACGGGLSCARVVDNGHKYQCCSESYICADMTNNSCIFGQEYYYIHEVDSICNSGNGNACGGIDEDDLFCARSSIDTIDSKYTCCKGRDMYLCSIESENCHQSDFYCTRKSDTELELGDICTKSEECANGLICTNKDDTFNSKSCELEDNEDNEKELGEDCKWDKQCKGDNRCASNSNNEKKCCEKEGVIPCVFLRGSTKKLSDIGFGYLGDECVEKEIYCKENYDGSISPSVSLSPSTSTSPTKSTSPSISPSTSSSTSPTSSTSSAERIP